MAGIFTIEPKTQEDLVNNMLAQEPKTVIERLELPGIKTLHENPVADLAQVMAVIFKSRKNILEMKYVVGKYVELTLAV